MRRQKRTSPIESHTSDSLNEPCPDEVAHVCSRSKSVCGEDEGVCPEQNIEVIFDSDKLPIRGINYGHLTKWFFPKDLPELVEAIEPGDMLEFRRGIYSHWGVYCGMQHEKDNHKEPYILDLTVTLKSSEMICKKQLTEVAGNSAVRVNNSSDYMYEPTRDFSLMERRSQRFMEDNYHNLLTNNCEHFVKYCRYGDQFRQQALWDGVKNINRSLVAATIFASGLTGFVIKDITTAVAGVGLGACAVVATPFMEAVLKVLKKQPLGTHLKKKECK